MVGPIQESDTLQNDSCNWQSEMFHTWTKSLIEMTNPWELHFTWSSSFSIQAGWTGLWYDNTKEVNEVYMYIHKYYQHTDSRVIEQTVLFYQKQCYVARSQISIQVKHTKSCLYTNSHSWTTIIKFECGGTNPVAVQECLHKQSMHQLGESRGMPLPSPHLEKLDTLGLLLRPFQDHKWY